MLRVRIARSMILFISLFDYDLPFFVFYFMLAIFFVWVHGAGFFIIVIGF
jgi:hypothetical protein